MLTALNTTCAVTTTLTAEIADRRNMRKTDKKTKQRKSVNKLLLVLRVFFTIPCHYTWDHRTTHSCCWHAWSTSTPFCQHQPHGSTVFPVKLSTICSRAFPVAASQIWSSLPEMLFRHLLCMRSFQYQLNYIFSMGCELATEINWIELKTFLFKLFFLSNTLPVVSHFVT